MNGNAKRQSSRHHYFCDGETTLSHLKFLLPLLLAFGGALVAAADISKNVSIFKSSDSEVYETVIEALDRRMKIRCEPEHAPCLRIETHSFVAGEEKPSRKPGDLVITLGLKAREYADQYPGEGKIINAMIPARDGQLSESAIHGPKHPTLILDQPPIRSLLLIKHLIPGAERIGLLLSHDSADLTDALAQAAERLDLQLVVGIVEDEDNLGKQLAAMLDQIDVLLALPDNKIHNRRNVSSILLTTYRNRIPLIGYSAAYVKAGALAAVYSTPENIGDQLAETIVQASTGQTLVTQVVYPKYFSVSINARVARSLGIQLQQDSDKLEQLIRDAEQ